MVLYIQDATTAVIYRYPQIIWQACPLLLFGVSRIWMLAQRDVMHEARSSSPISLTSAALILLVFWLTV